MKCKHFYIYQGTVYWHKDYPLPGSGAHARIYGDKYYCQKCLDIKVIHEREIGDSYRPALPGTLPK
jgi:hypothetical protein